MTLPAHLSAMLPLLLTLTACVAPPAPGRRDAVASAQRLLAKEFGAQTTSERLDRIAAAPGALLGSARWPTAWSEDRRPLQRELERATALRADLVAGAAHEAGRRPSRAGLWRGLVTDWEQDLADDLELSMRLLATSPRPLGEISDREHRTAPTDDRPELTFWQRLRRRLGL